MKLMVRGIKNLYHFWESWFWVLRYGYPAGKMVIVGVTGTDGKTTTCTLIYEMLKAAGWKCGMVTTVAAKYLGREGEVTVNTGLHNTVPDAKDLQALLRRMEEAGVTHVVLETTSHALEQNRVEGVNFRVAVLTNITHEHLDYHGTMEKYKEAKKRLFTMPSVKEVVLNEDDGSYAEFKLACEGAGKSVAGYKKSRLSRISSTLSGDYNKYNVAAAEATAGILGVEKRIVKAVVAGFAGVSGRREEVVAGQKFKVYVDFAHTPNALEAILTQLRKELAPGARLIVVFGCTGERDRSKRPMMGRIAEQLAEVVIITSDDTRSENQDDIAAAIIGGFANYDLRVGNGTLIKENDRRIAIRKAVSVAKPGDILLLAGKGHEKTILLGGVDHPWSDADVAREEVRKLV